MPSTNTGLIRFPLVPRLITALPGVDPKVMAIDALACASVVAALPALSRAKPAVMSMVSTLTEADPLSTDPNPLVDSRAVALVLSSTTVSIVLLVTFAELISARAKVTSAVAISSPLMSHVSLLQLRLALMSVLEVSPLRLLSRVL